MERMRMASSPSSQLPLASLHNLHLISREGGEGAIHTDDAKERSKNVVDKGVGEAGNGRPAASQQRCGRGRRTRRIRDKRRRRGIIIAAALELPALCISKDTSPNAPSIKALTRKRREARQFLPTAGRGTARRALARGTSGRSRP